MENTFFMIMFTFGGLMGLLTLVYVIRQAFNRQAGEVGGWELRGARQRITAVARTTLAEGIRAKVASGFALMILVAIPLFWLTAEGDGTIKGRLQMFISYSMGFTGFILALLTILFSCRSLSVEIVSRQIYGVVSKPIPRWQIVAGKWVGIMTLNVLLLALAVLMTRVGTTIIVERYKGTLLHDLETYGALTPSQAAAVVDRLEQVRGPGAKGMGSPLIAAFADALGKTRQQIGDILIRLPEPSRVNLRRFDELRRQVLVARTGIPAPVPDLTKDIDELYDRLKSEDRLPEGWSDKRIRDQIRTALGAQYITIAPGDGRQWEMKGPPPQEGSDHIMSIRFKFRTSSPPLAARFEGRTLEADTLLCLWGLGDPRKPNFLEQADTFPVNTTNELEIPQQGIEPDGTIRVSVVNIDPRRLDAIFDIEGEEVEVLYRVGSFELSLFQAALALLIPLACLAAFGVCASTFLSFPVGALIVLTLYIISSSMGFVADSLAVSEEYAPPDYDRDLAYQIRKTTVETFGWVLSIGDVDPVRHLIEGRAVGWRILWEKTWKFVLVKGMLVMLVAVWVFRRRELAAVIV
ncbi:MAG TPA: ABC transporter permease [Phycisphaerae bacterium]|nr:ABC transporter permease [Phycisphaerae bacterium]